MANARTASIKYKRFACNTIWFDGVKYTSKILKHDTTKMIYLYDYRKFDAFLFKNQDSFFL